MLGIATTLNDAAYVSIKSTRLRVARRVTFGRYQRPVNNIFNQLEYKAQLNNTSRYRNQVSLFLTQKFISVTANHLQKFIGKEQKDKSFCIFTQITSYH